MAEAKIKNVMYEETFDNLVSDMKNRGSKDEAGFLLLGHDFGKLAITTDHMFVGYGHRTNIDIPANYREGLELKLRNTNELERALYFQPYFVVGNYAHLKKLGFGVDHPELILQDGILMYPIKAIVGGAHTHPNLGAFLSDLDKVGIKLFLESRQRTPYTYTHNPWTEVVYDPVRKKFGVFESPDGIISKVAGIFVGNKREVNEFLRQTLISDLYFKNQ